MNNKLIGLLLSTLLFSCQEEMDLTTSNSNSRLVVAGSITSEYKFHAVELSLSGGLSINPNFQKVSGAIVSIIEGNENTILLTETEPGLYLTDSIAGKVGEMYTLNIEWDGQLFSASDSLLRLKETISPIDATPLGSFREYEFRRHKFGLNAASKEVIVVYPATPKTKVDTTRAGLTIGVKLLTGGAYQFTGFNHPKIEVNGLLNFEDGKYYGFKEGATVTHQLYGISDQHYEYLRSVFIETEWRGTLFDTTPANVHGNVSNDALGFFSANDVSEISYILN
jgi:hypothetical protein